MIIDSHQHFWIYNPVRDAWIDDTMKILQRDFLPEHLSPILNELSINGTISVQADQSEDETEFLLDLAQKNKFILGVVGWIDLKAKNVEERLEYFSSYKKLKGFRHIVQAEPDANFLFDEKFQNGISLLNKYNFTYDILIFPHQLPSAIKFVKNNSDQKFILDHIAKPYIRRNEIKPWARDIIELAKSPNIFCKLSGIITEADHKNWKAEDIFPYLDIITEAFGIDRLLFGSDWPVCLLGGSYKHTLDLIKEYFKNESEETREKIFSKNAISFYGIEVN